MRIKLISPSFYPSTYYGGPIQSTYKLSIALMKKNVDVRVITTNANGKEKLEVKTGVIHKLENELPVKYYRSLDSRGTSISMLLNLWKEIKNSDLVYLVSIFSPPTPYTIFLSRFYKKPLIISPRGQLGRWCLEQGNKFKKLWLHTFVLPYIKYLHWHLTSPAEEKDVLSVYPSAKTFVIPNGVNEELFSLSDKPKDKSFYNKFTGFDCTDKKIIISMGRLDKVKGFNILIESIGMIAKLVPNLPDGKAGLLRDLVLFIAGEDFGEKKNLEILIDKLALKEKVFLIGRIDGLDKIKFLRNADVFALASHHENFGMVIAEALAAGTPVIASRNTPWQDVEKQNCGKWIENTPEKFAEAITEIIKSDQTQMRNNGTNYIREYFDWEKIALEFKEKLEEIVADNNTLQN
ncbi:MAG: glycosyltransferase [Ignavibacteriota bacterium]|nr:glycosyltransferase [Ignavibacteriales bacterium]QKJ97589.1 MAG: glycosyltransferase [Ignavibacteriota bacterium]GIK62075.1 MAG: glycosyl transferase [Ignavibacteriota bacterium]